MFDFTKEVVINKKNWAAVDGATGKKFRVHGGGDYHAKYVVAGRGYKTAPQKGELAVLKIDADALVAAMASEAMACAFRSTIRCMASTCRSIRARSTGRRSSRAKPILLSYARATGAPNPENCMKTRFSRTI